MPIPTVCYNASQLPFDLFLLLSWQRCSLLTSTPARRRTASPNSTQNGGGTIMNKPYFQHALVWSPFVPACGCPVVQFSHFSVKEFLLSDRLATSAKDISRYHIALEDANTLTARACLGFLLWDPVCESDVTAAPSPLAEYAAACWVNHAKVENVASRIRNGMESLFDPERPYFSAWIKLHNADKRIWTNGLDSKKKKTRSSTIIIPCCVHWISRDS